MIANFFSGITFFYSFKVEIFQKEKLYVYSSGSSAAFFAVAFTPYCSLSCFSVLFFFVCSSIPFFSSPTILGAVGVYWVTELCADAVEHNEETRTGLFIGVRWKLGILLP